MTKTAPGSPIPFAVAHPEIYANRTEVMTLLVDASNRSLGWYRTLDRSSGAGAGGIDNKQDSGFDPVTEADRAVERQLRDGLGQLFPDHGIIGEEYGRSDGSNGDYTWMIDPIDGTRAFITGQPMWGTLLGLQYRGDPIAGWMHAPVLSETYVAIGQTELVTNSGTVALTTSSVETLSDAILLCTHPDMFAPGPEADGFARLDAATKLTRYSGDCINFGLLAMGLADLVVENGLQPYDIAPLIPIIEQAGGVVTDLDGNRPVEGGYVVAASNEMLLAKAVRLLREEPT